MGSFGNEDSGTHYPLRTRLLNVATMRENNLFSIKINTINYIISVMFGVVAKTQFNGEL